MVHVIYPDNYYASDVRIKGMAADVLVDEMEVPDYKTASNLWHETIRDMSVEKAVFVLEDSGLITTVKEK
jgi:hypothetical protein